MLTIAGGIILGVIGLVALVALLVALWHLRLVIAWFVAVAGAVVVLVQLVLVAYAFRDQIGLAWEYAVRVFVMAVVPGVALWTIVWWLARRAARRT